MNKAGLLLSAFALAGFTVPAYAEYCIESNSGEMHCFDDDYNSNDIDYDDARIPDMNYNNENFPCWVGEDSCYGNYDSYYDYVENDYSHYSDYEYDLENGCYSDLPYLHSDGYCYSYPESDSGYDLENGCYSDLPYLHSDGYCYSYPESDSGYDLENGCYSDLPYLHSDGYCYSYPESDSGYDLENGCYSDLPYLHSDGYCYSYLETALDNHNNCNSVVTSSVDKIDFVVCDSKGNMYGWSVEREIYEDMIINGAKLSESHYNNPLFLEDSDGTLITTSRFDGFVYGAFESIIDDVYHNSDSNTDFIHEVWYIVSQLTDYNLDRDDAYYIGDEGRYALDTLSRGGGDCEDLVILIADMLVSSSFTTDWTIQYVYMDGANPLDYKEINHVSLYVNDGEYGHHVEATGEPSWDYYPNGIVGWYLDV